MSSLPVHLLHIYISPGHNFFGHHEKPPGSNPMHEVREVRCVAGKGLEGDRFLGYKRNYRGQITFFEDEVYVRVQDSLFVHDKEPSVFRRNVILRGIDLNTLIGKRFELQGIEFEGTEECSPCYWMDKAFAPGAKEALRNHGGLRARILTDGVLRRTEQNAPAELRLIS